MHRQKILRLLEQYAPLDDEEQQMRRQIVDFVTHYPDCFERSQQLGHITGSAWVISQDFQQALLLHHRKLDRWLQPGGHSDGDPDTLAVALREAQEETGLASITPANGKIFDVDIHTIPANKKEPAHKHYDVRFLLYANAAEPLLISEESNELAWIALDKIADYTSERSVMRMVEKTRVPGTANSNDKR